MAWSSRVAFFSCATLNVIDNITTLAFVKVLAESKISLKFSLADHL
jgi:hypothetical protein